MEQVALELSQDARLSASLPIDQIHESEERKNRTDLVLVINA
jgi:hypothetical protein